MMPVTPVGSNPLVFIARLASCNLTERSCDTLATVICSQTSHLRELDLSDNDLQDLGVASLCQGLEKPSCKLEKLW